MDHPDKKSAKKKTSELSDIINQMELTDITEYLLQQLHNMHFFSAAHNTFSKIDHILRHKASLSKFK
jgi:hypothetical protein